MRGTLSGLERDRFSSIPLFIPFYIFCLESGGYRSVYAGNTFDSEHLRESLAEDLEALAIDLEASTTLFGEGLRSVEGREGPVQATVDEWPSRPDWSAFDDLDAMLDEIDVAPERGASKANSDWSGTRLIISALSADWTDDRKGLVAAGVMDGRRKNGCMAV